MIYEVKKAMLCLRLAEHQPKPDVPNERSIGKQKRLSSTNGAQYSTNHDQHYRMRFGIT